MSLKSITEDLSSAVTDDVPVEFLIAYDHGRRQVDDLDDAAYTVLVAPHVGGYRSQLEIFNEAGSTIYEHTMDSDGLDLPALTREIAVGEAELILEHMHECHRHLAEGSPDEMRHVFIDDQERKVWGVKPIDKLDVGARNCDDDVGGAGYIRDRSYRAYDRRTILGYSGVDVHLMPKSVTDRIGADDTPIVELFCHVGSVQVTKVERAA